jgi:hypothetical protein
VEYTNVVAAFVCLRICGVVQAEPAAKASDIVEVVPFHPALEAVTHLSEVGRPVPQDRRYHLDGVRTSQQGLDSIVGCFDAAGRGQTSFGSAMQNRQPSKAQ